MESDAKKRSYQRWRYQEFLQWGIYYWWRSLEVITFRGPSFPKQTQIKKKHTSRFTFYLLLDEVGKKAPWRPGWDKKDEGWFIRIGLSMIVDSFLFLDTPLSF